MASSLSVCHNSGIVNTGISGSSLGFFLGVGGGGVGSDYMCTGHAVGPACRLVIPTVCHTCTKEDFMLVIGQVRQSKPLPTFPFSPYCSKHPNNISNSILK